MKPVVIFGLGKIADVVYHHIVRDGMFKVVAFTCDAEWITGELADKRTHYGKPVIAFEDLESHWSPENAAMFIAIGYHGLNAIRATRCAEAKKRGYSLVSYISAKADIGPWLDVGENSLILDGVGIQPGVKIGKNVWIWNNALIGHHSTVHDDCWIAAGATLGGVVSLGQRSFVGLNATICGELDVGDDCFVGAGALVTKSAPPKGVFIAQATDKFRLPSDQFVRMTLMPAIGPSVKTQKDV
ncbi:MAG: hypothetical protein ING54_02340 [Rhodocyclaceae bacterium]|jgi:sugar O-acyltransferase (sialic acid O-acetyltransferase NeuD family)|nr:hypothetical protein [Rhodocyclaceae bacterium]MCA3051879.1 hypothetical protein [Rhodocyclaceae bacterium]